MKRHDLRSLPAAHTYDNCHNFNLPLQPVSSERNHDMMNHPRGPDDSSRTGKCQNHIHMIIAGIYIYM